MKYFILIVSILLIPIISFADVPSNVVWEVRSGGDVDNGGGFADDGTGTDYSQQDSPHATYTDIAIDASDNTIITSAADNFASDDVGNVIHIESGTGFTAGWYLIESVSSGQATLDRAVGTTSSTGGVATLGGAMFWDDDEWRGDFGAGNIVWVKADGTYTLTEHWSGSSGPDSSNPVEIIGYNTTRGDQPTGDDRPVIAAGSNFFYWRNGYFIKNIRGTGTDSSGFWMDVSSAFNVKWQNTSGTSGRDGFDIGAPSRLINVEAISDNGNAIDSNGADNRILFSYIHDSDEGVTVDNHRLVFIGNVVENIANTCLGNGNIRQAYVIVNNVFDGCTTGLNGGGAADLQMILNNVITNNTTGISWDVDENSNIADYNLYYNNSTDVSNFSKGANAITGSDPLFTNRAGADFTYQSGSPAIGAAHDIGVNLGLVGDYKWNIGVDQDDVSSGSAGTTSSAYAN